MSEVSQRIANWLWRDIALRGGFREVVDSIPPGTRDLIIEYWTKRIEEEIGDNRLIKALEEIANDPANAVTHFEDKWRTIAKRALGPRRDEQAAAVGVTHYAADGHELRAVQQDLFSTPKPAASERPVAGPTPATGPVEEIADI